MKYVCGMCGMWVYYMCNVYGMYAICMYVMCMLHAFVVLLWGIWRSGYCVCVMWHVWCVCAGVEAVSLPPQGQSWWGRKKLHTPKPPCSGLTLSVLLFPFFYWFFPHIIDNTNLYSRWLSQRSFRGKKTMVPGVWSWITKPLLLRLPRSFPGRRDNSRGKEEHKVWQASLFIFETQVKFTVCHGPRTRACLLSSKSQ